MGQGPTALVVGAGGGSLDIFSLIYHFSFLSPSLGDGRYRLKYCLKDPLNPKQTTNQLIPLIMVRTKMLSLETFESNIKQEKKKTPDVTSILLLFHGYR